MSQSKCGTYRSAVTALRSYLDPGSSHGFQAHYLRESENVSDLKRRLEYTFQIRSIWSRPNISRDL